MRASWPASATTGGCWASTWASPTSCPACRELAEATAALAGRPAPSGAVQLDEGQPEPYGQPTDATREALELAARTEGLLLDPVYTGRALAALVAGVRQGRLGRDRPLVFLHTGGLPGPVHRTVRGMVPAPGVNPGRWRHLRTCVPAPMRRWHGLSRRDGPPLTSAAMLAEREGERRPAGDPPRGGAAAWSRPPGPLTVLVAVLVVALLGVGLTVWRLRSPKAAAPSSWGDLSGVAADVEAARGLRFDRPVRVDLLGAVELAGRAADDPAAPAEGAGDPAAQARRLERRAQALVALGIEGDVDETVWSELPRSARFGRLVRRRDHDVVVLGRDPASPEVRGRLLEELTRAVVHQRLRAADTGGDRPEDHVRRALLEGDARRIARDDPEAGPALSASTLDEVGGLGESTVRVLLAWGGQQALDDGQRSPAPSVRAIFDPIGWEERPQPADVEPPRAEDGEKVVTRGWLGPATWLRLLVPTNTFGVAVRATYGWSGDAYTLVRRGDDTCIRVNVATDSLSDAVELDAALSGWVAAGPGGARQVVQEGDHLTVSACTAAGGGTLGDRPDHGAGAVRPRHPAERTRARPRAPARRQAPAGRRAVTGRPPWAGQRRQVGAEVLWAPFWVNALLAAAAQANPRPAASVARCAAIEAVAATPLSQLADPEAPQADLQRRYGAALDSCQTRQGGGSVLPTTSR